MSENDRRLPQAEEGILKSGTEHAQPLPTPGLDTDFALSEEPDIIVPKPLSARKTSRVRAFGQIVKRVKQIQTSIENTVFIPAINEKGVPSKNDQGQTLGYSVDKSNFSGLSHLAFRIYEGIAADPAMKQEASKYLQPSDDGTKEKEVQQLQRMHEVGADEPI